MQSEERKDTLKHIAIVMDGNGRWAKQRLLPRIAGHRAGATAVREVVECSVEHGLEVLTLFALSTENFNERPPKEVELLLKLFLESLKKNISELNDQNVRLQIIGDRTPFSDILQQKIADSEQLTKKNTGLQLVIALNYSGRWDIVRATQRLVQQALDHKLTVDEITTACFQNQLCLADLPEPDLLIRTSGEQRISNFLLWQFAYTELYFSNLFWPDFDKIAFEKAIAFYHSKERRFGRILNLRL